VGEARAGSIIPDPAAHAVVARTVCPVDNLEVCESQMILCRSR
jgi:hypothetical protein